MKLKIADLSKLKATSGADGLQLYAMSRLNPLRWVFHKRLSLLASLFPSDRKFQNLLEVGYGSGILIPHYLQYCHSYYGIDIHDNHEMVLNEVVKGNPNVSIGYGNITSTEFDSDKFDCITSLSVMEHIKDVDKAIAEISRIMSKGGLYVVGFPIENIGSNLILDAVKYVIGFDRKIHHPTNHKQILVALQQNLTCVKEIYYPFQWARNMSLFYCGVWEK
jgi:ubiquinone/menaquinone biosynthesis C-methylase UbiE